jgi:hypothetical protein
MISRASEKSGDEAASQHRAGYADILARSAWLAWLVFALLAASLPAKADTAFEKSPVVTSFSSETLAILRHDAAPYYRLDNRARLEWSRNSIRGSMAKAAGGSALSPSSVQPVSARLSAAVTESIRTLCDPAPIRFFDAQGPPLRP